jgi:hypothetical protein
MSSQHVPAGGKSFLAFRDCSNPSHPCYSCWRYGAFGRESVAGIAAMARSPGLWLPPKPGVSTQTITHERRIHHHEPPLSVLLQPGSASLGQRREGSLHRLCIPQAVRAVLVDARSWDAVVAAATDLGYQPFIEPDGCGEVGRGVEIGQEPSSVVQLSTDHCFGGVDAMRVDHCDGPVRQYMEQRRNARCSRRPWRPHVAGVASSPSESSARRTAPPLASSPVRTGSLGCSACWPATRSGTVR